MYVCLHVFSVIVVIKFCLFNNNNNIHSNKNPPPPSDIPSLSVIRPNASVWDPPVLLRVNKFKCTKPAIACSLQAPFRSWTGTRAVKILFKFKAFSAFSALDQFEYYWIESVKSFWQACMKIDVQKIIMFGHMGAFIETWYRSMIRHWNILITPSNLIQEGIAAKMYKSNLCLTMNKRNHWNVVKGTLKMTLLVGVQYLNYHA